MSDNYLNGLSADARALLARLKTERDQLEVRMHLAKADLRDEWKGLETRWQDVEGRARAAANAAESARPAVTTAMKQLGEELAEAYRRVRKAIE